MNFSSQGEKPIRVLENNTHFLVEISASQKIRASRIAGRRWDSQLVAWVYPKTIDSYEALKVEFSRDAVEFDIRKPKRKSVPVPVKSTVDDENDHDFENEWKEMSEKTSSIHDTFSEMTGKIDYLVKSVHSLEESNNSLEQMLLIDRLEASMDADKDSNSEVSKEIDAVEQFEQLLKEIALGTSEHDASFRQHLEIYRPLKQPERFIMRTHEHLLKSLAEMSGNHSPQESAFAKYVENVKANELVPRHIPGVLFMLNSHRNRVVHSTSMSEHELQSRAIIYLMGVSHIWREVASEPVGDE